MWNFKLLRVWGIPIQIHVSLILFLPVLAWLVGSGAQIEAYATLINGLTPAAVDTTTLAAGDRWLIGVLAATGIFGSVAVHELGHSWAAMRYGIETESITLWILGGLANLSEMPKEWNREFWIAVAGPITSVLVGVVCIATLYAVPASASVLVFVVAWLGVMNLFLAGFNMLPAFPMDGGRILRALLARSRPYASATRLAARVGVGFAFLFAVFGVVVVFSPIMLLLALFIYVAATSESRSVVLEELLAGLTVADLVTDSEPVEADDSVATLLDRLLRARRTDLAIVDAGGRVTGVVTASTLRDLDVEEYGTTTVGAIATTDLPRFDADTPAFDALLALMSSRADVAIVERDGAPDGIVSRSDFTAALDIRRDAVAF